MAADFPYVTATLVAVLAALGGALPVALPIMVLKRLAEIAAAGAGDPRVGAAASPPARTPPAVPPRPALQPQEPPDRRRLWWEASMALLFILACSFLGFVPLISAMTIVARYPAENELLGPITAVAAIAGVVAVILYLLIRGRWNDPVARAARRAKGPLPIIVAVGVFDGENATSNGLSETLEDPRVRSLWDRFEWRVPLDYGKHERVLRKYDCLRSDRLPQVLFVKKELGHVSIDGKKIFVGPEVTSADRLVALLQLVILRYGKEA